MAGYAAITQFFHYAAVLLLLGVSLFRLYGWDPAIELADRKRIQCDFDRWLRNTLLVAAAVALFSALAWWDSLAASMGDGWPDALNIDVLVAVLFETEFGEIWVWRLLLLVMLLGALLMLRTYPWRRWQITVIAVFSAAAVLTLIGIGHAARNTGPHGVIHYGAKAVHLLAAAIWLGGLVSLGYILGKARQDKSWAALARHILPRFSWAGYFAVSLILLSGCVISWFHIGTLPALISTIYGRVLVAKICLFLLMATIALFNRLLLTPAIVAPPRARRVVSVAKLWKSVSIEQSIGIMILLVASILAMLPPAHAS
jgi:putative copper resistance protein D